MIASRPHLLISLTFLGCSTLGTYGLDIPYDPEEARGFASLASIPYCRNLTPVLDWTCTACAQSKTPLVPGKIRVIDAGNYNATRIVVGRLRDQPGCVMSFRGSANVFNWVRDFQVWQIEPSIFDDCVGCKVHRGFHEIWNNVRDPVMAALKDVGCGNTSVDANVIYITGHSLGAALTHIAMFTLQKHGFDVKKTYSFSGPRIGNKAFADAFENRFTRDIPVFRHTFHKDPVPHLPPLNFGYVHVRAEVYYNQTGGYTVCEKEEDKRCANQYWDIPGMVLFNAGDHCTSPLVPNGNICKPIGCDVVLGSAVSEVTNIVV